MKHKSLLILSLTAGVLILASMLIGGEILYGQDPGLVTPRAQGGESTTVPQNEFMLQKETDPNIVSDGETITYILTYADPEAQGEFLLQDMVPSDLLVTPESLNLEPSNVGEILVFCRPRQLSEIEWPDCENTQGIDISLSGSLPIDRLQVRYKAGVRPESTAEVVRNELLLVVNGTPVATAVADVVISHTGTVTPPTPIPTSTAEPTLSPVPTSLVTPISYMPVVRRQPTPTPPPLFPLIVNGNFESPRTEGKAPGWEESGVEDDLILCKDRGILPNALNPRSPQCVAWLGGFDGQTTAISQTVTIDPYYQGKVKLKLYYALGSSESCGSSGDLARVYVNDAPVDEPSIPVLCNDNETPGWPEVLVDLGDASGDVTIKFEVAQNESLNSNWFLDDVSLCTDDASLAGAAPPCNDEESNTR